MLVKPKKYYQSYLKKKKLVKRSKILAQQPRSIENPKTVDIKLVFIEYPKTSRKLSKTIIQAKKVGFVKSSNSPLYSEAKKSENFLNKKINVKITKRSHAYRGYSSTFNLKNKLINLLSKLGGFKLVTTLVLEFRK